MSSNFLDRWWSPSSLAGMTKSSVSVLVTGAAGQVGSWIRPALRANFDQIRLTDYVSLPSVAGGVREHFQMCDLTDANAVMEAAHGVQQIVHLGALSKDSTIERISPPNILGVTHLLDAAIALGVRRVVLISSMHVLGMYRRDERVTVDSPPRPDSLYALTKLYGEELARLYHERHGLSVVIVRPGHVTERAQDAEPDNWVSADDLARLVVLALKADVIGFEVWHAVTSADADDPTHRDLARRFGFQFSPKPAAEEDLDSALRRWYPDDELARRYRGGVFASGRAM